MAAEPVTIRFGGYQPPASVHSRAARLIGEELDRSLAGRIRFEVDGDVTKSGHKAADLLTLVESGELSMCYFSASYLAGRVPEFALLDLPFTLTNRTHAYAVLDGPLGTRLTECLDTATGYRLLAFWDNGFRHLSNKVRPIRRPEDCEGIRIRTLFSDLHQRVFATLGFEPVPLDVKDLVEGVRSGTIAAQENPLTNYWNFGFQAHHRHITLSAHFFGAAVLLCHGESYRSWREDVRNAVHRAVEIATQAQRSFAAAEDDEVLARLAERDVDIVRLSPAERERFLARVRPLIDEQRERFGPELFRHLERTRDD